MQAGQQRDRQAGIGGSKGKEHCNKETTTIWRLTGEKGLVYVQQGWWGNEIHVGRWAGKLWWGEWGDCRADWSGRISNKRKVGRHLVGRKRILKWPGNMEMCLKSKIERQNEQESIQLRWTLWQLCDVLKKTGYHIQRWCPIHPYKSCSLSFCGLPHASAFLGP